MTDFFGAGMALEAIDRSDLTTSRLGLSSIIGRGIAMRDGIAS